MSSKRSNQSFQPVKLRGRQCKCNCSTQDLHHHLPEVQREKSYCCSLDHSSLVAQQISPKTNNYRREISLLQVTNQSSNPQSSDSSFISLTNSTNSDNISHCSNHSQTRQRNVPNCRSPQTPLLGRHPGVGVEDCGNISRGSLVGSSESSYLDFDRTSLLSGIANLELSSPSYHYSPCHSPLANPRLAQFVHSQPGHVQSQPASPSHRHHRTRQIKTYKTVATRRHQQNPVLQTRACQDREREQTPGCCSLVEPTFARDSPPKEPVVSAYVKGFMSWMSKGTSALMDVLPSTAKEDFHLVMIGLDGAGKTTALYRMKLDQYLHTVPTIGFNCERVAGTVGRSAGLTFLVWDVGGQEKIRPLWRSYTRCTDGIIFVLDCADYQALDEARMELHRTLQYQDNRDIPLLVMANKQDLPMAIGEEEVIKTMGLKSLNSSLWSVELTCSITGEGLDTGIEMMHTMIMKRKIMAKRNRNKTR